MTDRFWKSMPAALKEAALDELYRRFKDLDHSQVDERVAMLLNAILQLESQGEGRESATEEVLLVGYTSDGVVGGLHLGLSNTKITKIAKIRT